MKIKFNQPRFLHFSYTNMGRYAVCLYTPNFTIPPLLSGKKSYKKKCKLYVEMVKYGYAKKAHQTFKMANQGS